MVKTAPIHFLWMCQLFGLFNVTCCILCHEDGSVNHSKKNKKKKQLLKAARRPYGLFLTLSTD